MTRPELGRLCPETDCQRLIERREFACREHWRVLRPETKTRIEAAFREWCRRPTARTAKALEAEQAIGIRELSLLEGAQ
jgi:hypothetical protein